MRTGQLAGLLGAAILAIGVFCPFVTLPIAGSISLFNQGRGDGIILLVLAASCLALVLLDRLIWLWYVAALALAVLAYDGMNLSLSLLGTREAMKIGVGSNMFSGLADSLLSTIQVSWGLPVLIIGIGLILFAAITKKAEIGVFSQRIAPTIGIVIVAIGFIAGTVQGEQSRTAIVQKAQQEENARLAAEKKQAEERAAEEQRLAEERQAAERAAAEEETAKQDAINRLQLVKWDWESGEYSTYIVGTVKNGSDRTLEGISVSFDLFDADENKIGTADDYLSSLSSGETWAFRALATEDNIATGRLGKLTGRVQDY